MTPHEQRLISRLQQARKRVDVMKQCTTHHHACDCRERKHAEEMRFLEAAYCDLVKQRDELLAACEEMVAWCESNDVVCYALDEVMEAIKKAKGK